MGGVKEAFCGELAFEVFNLGQELANAGQADLLYAEAEAAAFGPELWFGVDHHLVTLLKLQVSED